MGKDFLDEKINEDLGVCLQVLSDLKGKPTSINKLITKCVSNIICAILIGDRFEYDDPYFIRLLELLDERVVLLGNLPTLNALPWLKYLPGDFFGHKRILANTQDLTILVGERFIKEPTSEEECVENFINSYYEMRNMKMQAGVPTNLDDDNLLMVILNLFAGASETTTAIMLWCILYAMHHPETQAKVFNEITDVLGTERNPCSQDKQRMPYTISYINEILRSVSVTPLSLPHLCSEDVNIGGYTIPKGTTVVANLDTILHDEDFWKDPFAFRPERFLDKGQIQTLPEEFIPFSVGRRYCPGASLAKTELFLFFTRLLQRFEIRADDPKNLPPLEHRFGLTSSPNPYKVRLIERN